MSNPICGQIKIGGNIPENLISGIEKALVNDLYSKEKVNFRNHIEDDYFQMSDDCVGEFETTGYFCYENKIPFIIDVGTYDDLQPEMRVFIPEVIDKTYLLSLSGDIILGGSDMMGLQEAITTVTFENAALKLNNHHPAVKEYSSFLLAGGEPMDFVKKIMKEAVPPRVPELPKLRIIKSKPKRKSK